MNRATARGVCSVLTALTLLAGLVPSDSVRADNWPTWRGPSGNGIADGSDYPIEFGPQKNHHWTHDLNAMGGSTPIVWGDQILMTYVTSFENGKNAVRCYDWQGNVQWERVLGDAVSGKHRKASGCNPSPVTDGKHVFAYYKSGELACLDLAGNVVWTRNLQKDFAEDTLWWDLGTSPVLTREHVVVAVVQSGPSYLAAFDKQTGEVAWKVDRMLDAPEEANQTYSTPVVAEHQGKEWLVVVGADHVTAHQAADGKEIWRVGGLNPTKDGYFRSIASAVVTDGVVVAPYSRGKTLTGIDLATGKQLWHSDELPSSDVPTPAAENGNVYILSDKGGDKRNQLLCLEAKTGKERWQVEVDRREDFSSSPTIAGDKAYLAREDGTVYVYQIGEKPELLATNQLEGFTVATPVLVNNKILIRTDSHLYCFGK
jgi:outer membrane protein assembly factor BamB